MMLVISLLGSNWRCILFQKVPFQVPLEINIVLVGFNADGGYRYAVDAHKLEEFLKIGYPTRRPACLETGELLDIEHRLLYNVIPVSH